MKTVNKGVSVKLFVGFILLPDNKNQLLLQRLKLLNDSPLLSKFEIVPLHAKEYFGFFTENRLTIEMIKKLADQITMGYKQCFPDQQIETFKLTVFSQVFIS